MGLAENRECSRVCRGGDEVGVEVRGWLVLRRSVADGGGWLMGRVGTLREGEPSGGSVILGTG